MDGPGLEKEGEKKGIIITIMAMVATTFLTAYQVHTVCVHNAIQSPMTLGAQRLYTGEKSEAQRLRNLSRITQLLSDGARN